MSRRDPRPHYGTYRRNRPDGYIDVWEPSHPIARSDGYVLEHRKVAWDAGLLTDPSLQVHHRNHDRSDNRLENLEVVDGAEHIAKYHAGAAGWAAENKAKTHCIRGHRLAGDNLVKSQLPNRVCRTCNNNRRRYAKGLPPKEVYA